MSETKEISNIMEQYADKERLSIILRLHKEGHVSEEEALNLLTGDRNYHLTATIQEIKKLLQSPFSTGYPWQGGNIVYTSGRVGDPALPGPHSITTTY